MIKYRITYKCHTPEQFCTTVVESPTIQGIIEIIEQIEINNPVFKIQKIINENVI